MSSKKGKKKLEDSDSSDSGPEDVRVKLFIL